MRQEPDTVTAMIRPTWTPENDVQRRALDDAVARARAADHAEDLAWKAILEARKLGVPDTILCDRTNRSRATLNRKFGPRSGEPEAS